MYVKTFRTYMYICMYVRSTRIPAAPRTSTDIMWPGLRHGMALITNVPICGMSILMPWWNRTESRVRIYQISIFPCLYIYTSTSPQVHWSRALIKMGIDDDFRASEMSLAWRLCGYRVCIPCIDFTCLEARWCTDFADNKISTRLS